MTPGAFSLSLAKSMMLGDEVGMVKLLFDRDTRKLLGVHALGQRATELIPIGRAVLFYAGQGSIFRIWIFNYQTSPKHTRLPRSMV